MSVIFVLFATITWAAAVALPQLTPLPTASSKEEAASVWRTTGNTLRTQGPGSIRPLYSQWKKGYNIAYSAIEDAKRYSIFEANVRRIVAINMDPNATFWAGLSPYTGLTATEARSTLIPSWFLPPPPEPVPDSQIPDDSGDDSSSRRRSLKAVASKKDWQALGKMTAVKDQGSCGGCWAFAGIAALEARVKIQTSRDYDLSEQQILDCHPTAWACWGGWIDAALSYAASTPIVADSPYPYTVGGCTDPATNDNNCFANRCPTNLCRTCQASSVSPGLRVQLTDNGLIRAPPGSVKGLKLAIAKGPVVIAMLTADDIFLYAGGVYTKREGECGPVTSVDHAVVAVGYDSTAAKPYWKIRNSWGPNWGEGGYFRMSMEPGTKGPCNIYVYGGYAPTSARITNNGAVVPSAEATAPLRLVQGAVDSTMDSTIMQGRLEIQNAGSWGTVCNKFTHVGAGVACRQMGKASVGYAAATSVFGAAAGGKVWMSDVRCTGAESRLQDCAFLGWNLAPCPHSQDVGVICNYFKVQLLYKAGTPTANRVYRVEAQINGAWGTICGSSFTDSDATVLCRSAGLSSAGRAVRLSTSSTPPAGVASQPIWIDAPGCTGSEDSLQSCPLTKLIGNQGCPTDHSWDVGVQCYNLPGVAAPGASRKAVRPAVKSI